MCVCVLVWTTLPFSMFFFFLIIVSPLSMHTFVHRWQASRRWRWRQVHRLAIKKKKRGGGGEEKHLGATCWKEKGEIKSKKKKEGTTRRKLNTRNVIKTRKKKYEEKRKQQRKILHSNKQNKLQTHTSLQIKIKIKKPPNTMLRNKKGSFRISTA